MAIDQSIIDIILETINDRFISLENELVQLKEKKYPTLGPYKLIEFIEKANTEIYKRINKNRDVLTELTEEQVEILLYRYSKLIPYLHILLRFLKGAEIKDTPVSLIKPLKRLIEKFLPDSEVIFRSDPELNYSFIELAEHIRGVFEIYFGYLLKDFPKYFIIISFPEVEKENVLLHCIIAHEIGHGLYLKYKISNKLKKLVYSRLKKKEIEKITSSFFQKLKIENEDKKKQPILFPSKLDIQDIITTRTNYIIESWLEELASDGIAICILGPAYYFSFIYFIISCEYINDISDSHPSPKSRILFMSNLLKEKNLNYLQIFTPKMKEFFMRWFKIANTPSYLRDPIISMILKIINVNLNSIGNIIISSAKDDLLKIDLDDIKILDDMIINIIPPCEIIDPVKKIIKVADIFSILNAAWYAYISDFDIFREKSGRSLKNKRKYDFKVRFNEILLKALEIYEIKKTQEEQ
ncbi:MAG: hypothetical protein ACTSQG_11275 [Promethearchaeota archaeon]